MQKKYLIGLVLSIVLAVCVYYVNQAQQPTIVSEIPVTATTTQEASSAAEGTKEETRASTPTELVRPTIPGLERNTKVGDRITLSIPNRKQENLTITSVRQIAIPDKKVLHTVFEGCYESDALTYACSIFALNSNNEFVWLENGSSESGPTFGELISRKTKANTLNTNTGEEKILIRPENYPYVYQQMNFADATSKSGAWVQGFNIDVVKNEQGTSTHLAGIGNGVSSGMFDENSSEPVDIWISASKLIGKDLVEVELRSIKENSRASVEQVTVSLIKNDERKNAKILLNKEISAGKHDTLNIKYDYGNLAGTATIHIDKQIFVFNFNDQTFTEQL
jgi:hypothetical protein